MIIDTKGFDIGDEVWCIDFYHNFSFPSKMTIFFFILYKNKVFLKDSDNDLFEVEFERIFHTEQECQIACDKLNCKM